MSDIFIEMLNRSIAAGWLILVVILLRLLFRKAPGWIHCLLWGIVAVRLICPFSIESAYSLIPSAETVRTSIMEEGQIRSQIPELDSHVPVIRRTVNPILRDTFSYEEEESAAPLQLYTYIAGMVWCCGMVLLLAYAVITRLRLHYMMREAVCQEGDVYLCDAAMSPFVLGMIRPRIYLPSGMDMGRAHYVIAHEQAHLKRKDHWWKPLGYLLLAVYWFQPLCWAAYILFCRDIEFACDEKVIRDLSLNEKKEYSKALLSCSRQGRMVMACPLAFGEVSVKERVKSVLQYKKAAVWLLAAAMVACVIVGICFLTNPPKEYQIRITIPAGCTEPFSYSDEEVCSKNGALTFYAGEGLGDTEILLLPVKSVDDAENPLLSEERPSDGGNLSHSGETRNDAEISALSEEDQWNADHSIGPFYITPGMPVRFEVERGTWYRIGVNVQNPTDEGKNVYVTVNNVDVRIADRAEAAGTGAGGVEADEADANRAEAAGTGAGGTEAAGTGANRAEAAGTGAGGTEAAGMGAGGMEADGTGKTGQSEQDGADSADTAGAAGDGESQRYDLGDLDGNGVQEYLLLTALQGDSEYDMHLSFYFNGESIYEYDDLLVMYPGEAEYLDLDQDGEKEIFFTFHPMVNSMPLMEYAVLKQNGSGWKALEMIHGETMLDNGFPISSRYGSAENTLVITCEGADKEVLYNFKDYYEIRIREERENGGDPTQYAEILEQNKYKEGDTFGGIAAWGVWEICSGTYDGRNCLIATHGLEGPLGKWDIIGLVDIYFDYDEKGRVNILDMEFREGL